MFLGLFTSSLPSGWKILQVKGVLFTPVSLQQCPAHSKPSIHVLGPNSYRTECKVAARKTRPGDLLTGGGVKADTQPLISVFPPICQASGTKPSTQSLPL